MSKRQKTAWAVGLVVLACLGIGPPPRTGIIAQPAPPEMMAASESPAMEVAEYNLLADSMFAEGCKGGGFGCMCPLRGASSFTGTLTLVPDPRTPPGHHAYNVTAPDWFVVLDGEEMQVSGSGYYAAWTELNGSSWQSMTLDLLIRGAEVHFSSGVVEGAVPGGAFPDEIQLTLEDNAECFGYVIALAAQHPVDNPRLDEGGPVFGGYCTYIDTPGVATIVAVEASDPGDLNCSNDPVTVTFDFQPNDPVKSGLVATNARLTISEGVNPPREWVEGEGLTVGSQYPCVRRDIAWGACTPLLFEFPAADSEAAVQLCYAASTFAMNVRPSMIVDAIFGQQIVLLGTVKDYGTPPVVGPIRISAKSDTAEVTVAPEDVKPGQVCEITVVPIPRKKPAAPASQLEPALGSSPYGDGVEVVVAVQGERGDFAHSRYVGINVLPGEDDSLPQASLVRDRFIPYLAANHPEFGITAETQWSGTIVKPHILVVTHYLFFSDEWEMGVMWHNMIPPYDWAKIYLRHRYTNVQPQYAFEISSLSADPAEKPEAIDPPAEVDR